MTNKDIKEIENYVEGLCDEEDWKYHVLLVARHAVRLARRVGVDKELAHLAGILHDIGRLPFADEKDKTHHLTGPGEAEKILRKYKYPQDRIDQIKGAILSHRGSTEPAPKTDLEKVIANADAMVHYDTLPLFYYWRGKRGFSFEDITDWLIKKYERNYSRKITMKEAREMVKDKHRRNLEMLKEILNRK